MITAGLRDTIGHPGHPRKAMGGLGPGRKESERETVSKGQERPGVGPGGAAAVKERRVSAREPRAVARDRVRAGSLRGLSKASGPQCGTAGWKRRQRPVPRTSRERPAERVVGIDARWQRLEKWPSVRCYGGCSSKKFDWEREAASRGVE